MLRSTKYAALAIILGILPLSELSGQRPKTSENARTSIVNSQDPLLVRIQVEEAMRLDLDAMREQWRREETGRHQVVPNRELSQPTATRILGAHCDFDLDLGVLRTIVEGGRQIHYVLDVPLNQFKSRVIRTSVCAAWEPAQRPLEDLGEHRQGEPPFSLKTVLLLDSASRRYPADPFFLRQHVRVLVQRQAAAAAETALQRCKAGALCEALAGYVSYHLKDWRAADSLFRRVLAVDESSLTCGWTTLAELYQTPEGWRPSKRCRGDGVDSTGWWLSWPLWTESVNHRWLAHVVRHIDWTLRSDLSRDLHWYTDPALGGDAVKQVFIRYGQPSHVFNAGDYHDRDHDRFLRKTVGVNYPQRPYGLPEYDRDNQSVFAAYSAVVAPLAVANSDFSLSTAALTPQLQWPSEFFRHPMGLVLNMADVQIALLRRNNYALVVAGVRLPASADSVAGPVPVSLLGQAPGGSLQVVDQREDARWGQGAVLTGAITQPLVLSAEALGGGRGVAGARYRWGVPQVPTTPAAGSCALSEPLLLHGAATEPTFEAVRQQVRSSTTLSAGSTTGLYWESYGFAASDSVDVQLIVESSARAADSPLERERVVSMAWREPSAATALVPVADHPTTLGRVMMLNLATLRKGTYQLRITMRSSRCAEVFGTRAFQVQ